MLATDHQAVKGIFKALSDLPLTDIQRRKLADLMESIKESDPLASAHAGEFFDKDYDPKERAKFWVAELERRAQGRTPESKASNEVVIRLAQGLFPAAEFTFMEGGRDFEESQQSNYVPEVRMRELTKALELKGKSSMSCEEAQNIASRYILSGQVGACTLGG